MRNIRVLVVRGQVLASTLQEQVKIVTNFIVFNAIYVYLDFFFAPKEDPNPQIGSPMIDTDVVPLEVASPVDLRKISLDDLANPDNNLADGPLKLVLGKSIAKKVPISIFNSAI